MIILMVSATFRQDVPVQRDDDGRPNITRYHTDRTNVTYIGTNTKFQVEPSLRMRNFTKEKLAI